ncbi:hypothetical protein B0O99DRAFT_711928 [Bisporella sp. PMI_857]|nr:hypothetical protein B0O99DRAFT_711928 [Bisporella sp. PMI_857]
MSYYSGSAYQRPLWSRQGFLPRHRGFVKTRNRNRDLMAYDTPVGTQLVSSSYMARKWPGLYDEAQRSGNRRVNPIFMSNKPAENFEDDYYRCCALDWISLRFGFYDHAAPFRQSLDPFDIYLEEAIDALNRGDDQEVIYHLTEFMNVFDWVVKLLEKDGGFSPSMRVYGDLFHVMQRFISLMLSWGGGAYALDLIGMFHRIAGRDLGEIRKLIGLLSLDNQSELFNLAHQAMGAGDKLGMKIVGIITGDPMLLMMSRGY